MIKIHNDRLEISFPEVHPDARCAVTFHRTLRVPDDNQDYPLPAGLGHFPLLSVDAFDTPAAWKQHGGVFFPMYQSEAMWMSFGASDYPFAVKVATGKINAITGQTWSDALSADPQDYAVLPDQPWLDGFSVSKDIVRQFVASPLGEGVTAEEQLTGEAVWGGLQLIFYPMKAEVYRKRLEAEREIERISFDMQVCSSSEFEMGLAPGGRITQEIAEDEYGIDAWDTSVSSRCFVHLLNSKSYRTVTGRTPPTEPITPKDYADAGVPWFDYYLVGKALPGSKVLAGLDGIAAALAKQGKSIEHNKPITITKTIDLSPESIVRDGAF